MSLFPDRPTRQRKGHAWPAADNGIRGVASATESSAGDVQEERSTVVSPHLPRARSSRSPVCASPSRRDSGAMYSPRRYFPQRNLAGHHLLTFYLRELSIAHKLGPAELALTIRPGRGHSLARRVAERVAGADCGLALVWRGVAVRNGRLRLGRRHKQHRRGADPARAVYFPGSRTGQRPHPAGWTRDRLGVWEILELAAWIRVKHIGSPPGIIYVSFTPTSAARAM